MIKFNSNVMIEGHIYSAGQNVEEVPEEVEKNWYYQHLIKIGEIVVEKTTSRAAKS